MVISGYVPINGSVNNLWQCCMLPTNEDVEPGFNEAQNEKGAVGLHMLVSLGLPCWITHMVNFGNFQPVFGLRRGLGLAGLDGWVVEGLGMVTPQPPTFPISTHPNSIPSPPAVRQCSSTPA